MRDKEIINAYNQMISIKDICATYNVDSNVIYKLRKKYNTPDRGRVKGGTKEYDELCKLITIDYKNNIPLRAISIKYKRGITTISKMLRNSGVPPKTNSDIILPRFLENIDKNSDCWIWLGSKSTQGYGRFKIKGKYVLAHRLSYEIHIGKIPTGMFVCHHCDNPICINPTHLFIGTAFDNVQDCLKKDRFPVGEKSSNSKLTRSQALEIKTSSKKCRELEKEYGMSKGCIWGIKSGKNWKHLKKERQING